MITTCTVNPSLDYYLEFRRPLHAGTNRSMIEYYEAGGKGINISIVLSNLGIPTKAFGFVGGFTKDFFIKLLSKYEEIRPNFTYIENHTRINVKCRYGADSDLNAMGPQISPKEIRNLRDKVSRLSVGDYFAFSGAAQEDMEDDMVDMLKELNSQGVEVVLDTNPKIIRRLLEEHPFMVKTTPDELEQILGYDLTTPEELIAGAKKVHELGAERVLLLCDKKTAFLFCDEGSFQVEIVDETAVNTVGTGDAMVAGFLMNYMRSRNNIDSFKYGACCGKATAYSTGFGTKNEIDSYYQQTEVQKLD